VTLAGRRIAIGGVVQGVGFRPAVYRLAREQGLSGRVANDGGGVTIDAFGPLGAIERFLERIVADAPPAARIRSVSIEVIPEESLAEFRIVPSLAGEERRVSIPPDLPTCPACLSELFDPGDRRYRYAFINCTDCGPRFTIARDVPYDRAATTMAGFTMCALCSGEYDDPLSRRFHAQPNACPECGPRLTLWDGAEETEVNGVTDPLETAAGALGDGRIVAVKGIGGFHLACDATFPHAVARLRQRKRREEKPFAVMVRDLAAARGVAALTETEEKLLASSERPIVLVTRRPGCPLADEVAPGNRLVGLILAYAPVHHLLLESVGRPLVMTSGNLSEDPIAHEDTDARSRLSGIADLVLGHDRPIETPCDDSVARVVAGRPLLVRRARGYVPDALTLATPFARPVLAVGGHLKNTFCLASGDRATLGPHIGDLDSVRTYGLFRKSIARMERFLGIAPEVIAYDLHPGYLSTEYALARRETRKVAVQHHHAHVAAVMAEHALAGPVLGLAYDGTGYGMDGTAWGGELLLATRGGFTRLATFRPLPLAGGEAAIREPWRVALAMILDALGPEAALEGFPLFCGVEGRALSGVRRMLERKVNAPLAHGAGRWFDAVGALVLQRPVARYEGQVALEWDLVAEPGEAAPYSFELMTASTPWELDLRPMVRALVEELRGGTGAPAISARFHETLIAASAEMVREAAALHGKLPVVLSGGCFVNRRLAEGILAALGTDFEVFLPERVPPGDAGLALGQAVVADAILREER
jgi:hydrogenase maturation protein HypF